MLRWVGCLRETCWSFLISRDFVCELRRRGPVFQAEGDRGSRANVTDGNIESALCLVFCLEGHTPSIFFLFADVLSALAAVHLRINSPLKWSLWAL